MLAASSQQWPTARWAILGTIAASVARAAPKWEHVDPMAVEVLLCIAKALSALFSPGDYPRLFLSDFLLILLKLSSLFATLPPTQLSRKGRFYPSPSF